MIKDQLTESKKVSYNLVTLEGVIVGTPIRQKTQTKAQIEVQRIGVNKDSIFTTDIFNLVFKGKLGEVAADYLKEGSRCLVDGQINIRSSRNHSGYRRWHTEVIVMKFLSKKTA